MIISWLVLTSFAAVNTAMAKESAGKAAELKVDVKYGGATSKDGSVKITLTNVKGKAVAGATVRYVLADELDHPSGSGDKNAGSGVWDREVDWLYGRTPGRAAGAAQNSAATQSANENGPTTQPGEAAAIGYTATTGTTSKNGVVFIPRQVARSADGSAWVWVDPPNDLARVIVRVPVGAGQVSVELPIGAVAEGEVGSSKPQSATDRLTVVAWWMESDPPIGDARYVWPRAYACPLSSEHIYRLTGLRPGEYELVLRIVQTEPTPGKTTEVRLDRLTIDPPEPVKKESGEHDVPNVLHP